MNRTANLVVWLQINEVCVVKDLAREALKRWLCCGVDYLFGEVECPMFGSLLWSQREFKELSI
jgi:hypothetical protein